MVEGTGLHPSAVALLNYFRHEHLPQRLQGVSAPFGELARHLAAELPSGPELTTALRKLLEAKDCAVRSALDAASDSLVQQMARDRVSQTLEVTVRIPDGLPPDVLGRNVAAEVAALLERSDAERSARP